MFVPSAVQSRIIEFFERKTPPIGHQSVNKVIESLVYAALLFEQIQDSIGSPKR